jgi:glycosyltransferase involved in cell wall biosynthesis
LLIPAITHPHKNHEFLLRLMANEWRNEDVKLVMVGGQGLAEGQIQSLISELGLADRVVRGGRVNAADRDALGTPVIASDCASLPEVIGDGGVVLPLLTQAWSGALRTVRENRAALIERGKQRCHEFTSAKSAQDLVIAYEKTLALIHK